MGSGGVVLARCRATRSGSKLMGDGGVVLPRCRGTRSGSKLMGAGGVVFPRRCIGTRKGENYCNEFPLGPPRGPMLG